MSIDELKAALASIPKKGVINKARRLQIQKLICLLLKKTGE
jgi:hypothetical protein